MPITITIHGENAIHALCELRDFAVGLQGRSAAIGISEAQNFAVEGEAHTADEAKAWAETGATEAQIRASEELIAFAPAINKPARVRGQPSPGAKRRTKAEIAEDDAAAVANVKSIKEDVLAGAAEQQTAYDSPEAQAQDAADEAAEAEAHKTGLTHDDLRQAVGRYQKKFGMAAAVAGVRELLGCAMVEVPEADLAAAIAKVDAAVAGEAHSVDQEKVAEIPAATKEDVQAAMIRYAKRFDGQTADLSITAAPFMHTDCPAIFKLLFGAGVEKLSQVPVDGYAKTISAIDEAITKNPFKR